MREFILRALKARTTPDFSLNDLIDAGRMDLVCRCISNALFISNDVRRDTIMHVCMDGPNLPPKTISFSGETLRGMFFDERNIAKVIQTALFKGKDLKLGESAYVQEGVSVAKKSFEGMIKEKLGEGKKLHYLHQDGKSLRTMKKQKNYVFVFGDYIGIPKNTEKYLDRLGAEKISVSPKMLFASHCIVVAHNELDLKE